MATINNPDDLRNPWRPAPLLCPEMLAVLLVIATIAAVAWQYWGMDRTLVITPGSSHPAWADNDQSEGGNSTATFSRSEAFRMDCTIRNAISYPFCNLFISLTPEQDGVDLSGYDTLEVELSHQASHRDTLRVYLNHFYTDDKPHDFPYKVNQQVINPGAERRRYTLDLNQFYVPSWWVYASRLAPQSSSANLTNVKELVLSTGDTNQPRDVTVELYRVALHGKWVDAESLYRVLLWTWLVFVVGYLGYRTYLASGEARARRREAAQLRRINRLLNVRSERLKHLAHRDELTGLSNRLGIRNTLEQAVRDHQNNGTPFSLLMLDIDHFKSVNDSHGHDVGDRVIKGVADLMQRQCRQSDTPVRWGGEEFLVVCQDSDIRSAATLAERIREAVRRHDFGLDRVVTCSVGVAQVKNGDIDALFREADQALYQAKGAGRDQVMPRL